jgi:hypothetical protein
MSLLNEMAEECHRVATEHGFKDATIGEDIEGFTQLAVHECSKITALATRQIFSSTEKTIRQ